MPKLRINLAMRYTTVLTALTVLFLASGARCVEPESPVEVTQSETTIKAPNEMGFIQRWLILDPIPYRGGLGDSAVKAAVAKEYFPDQMSDVPNNGDTVMVDGQVRTWRAVDTKQYNVNLYYFAEDRGNSPADVLFWAVTVVHCAEEMKDVRLAVGSNAASVSWLNGTEATGLFNNRQTVIDDGVSKRMTLKKGANVIRCAIINAGRGAADFCVRILGADDAPLTNFTIGLGSTPAEATGPIPEQPAELFPLSAVRLLDSDFTRAAASNRAYLLALEPDRLLAPFLREAGLEAKAETYGNWEGSGLDGHTGGHYLSALAGMIAAGHDTETGELQRRLDYLLDELARCQNAYGNGYIGGVPGSRAFWKQIRDGEIDSHGFGINNKWVPWYNVHKTFAGLRDAYQMAGKAKAREMLVGLGDWCVELVGHLDDGQMRRMLRAEHGGMLEVMADIYAITGDEKYLAAAERFHDHAVLDPLIEGQDRLTGLHANTQIPKVIGLARIAALTQGDDARSGAEFFWGRVTGQRSVAFGGNSESEHFNDPGDFGKMLESRQGPETCNTYNMLRLTEQLFRAGPEARYVDYYERALYNHILASIHPERPGFVYFTPLRPNHYRVYSQPETCFWCCVGSGIENPGRYGQFIYAKGSGGGIYVNLFIPSELQVAEGVALRQSTEFPDEAATRLRLDLDAPQTFTIYLRHPEWVSAEDFAVSINGESIETASAPASYVALQREWRNGDRIEVALPMHTRAEGLPDGSAWAALLHGPILLAAPAGTKDLAGIYADASRMGHVAAGALVPLDETPVLLASAEALPQYVEPDTDAGPMRFRLTEIVSPPSTEGIALKPFFRIHDERYQMYWHLATRETLQTQRESSADDAAATAALEAATLDSVAIGEQQPEVEHGFQGENTNTGIHEGRRWRDGQSFQYTLDTRGADSAELVVTYWGGDQDRRFDIIANGTLLANETLDNAHPGEFFSKRYPIPASVLSAAADDRVTIRFEAQRFVAGGIFDLRLMRPASNAN